MKVMENCKHGPALDAARAINYIGKKALVTPVWYVFTHDVYYKNKIIMTENRSTSKSGREGSPLWANVGPPASFNPGQVPLLVPFNNPAETITSQSKSY